jgi:glycine hydroxymethyltransferase
MQPDAAANRLKSLVSKHHDFRANCLNMIPSENVTSPSVREIVASDLMHRYGEYEQHNIDKRWDEGNAYVIEIEKIVRDLAKSLFGVGYVDLRPISGHAAILSAIGAFARPGTAVFETAGQNGGHEWYYFPKNISIVNYRSEFYPFDTKEWNIDVDATIKKIRRMKPSALILGASFYLFPHPVKELRSVADEVGAAMLCDEAHVLGLIAGKQWPSPLSQGAHVLTGSTHKTFPGPQKGVVMTNNAECAKKVANALYPPLTTNHHLMNVAAFGYALAEMLKHGEAYAKQTIRNAQAFGASLAAEGFEVVAEHKGFTRSHQILIKTDKHIPGSHASKLLEKANIIANKMELQDANGLRTGTNELTRMGMGESDMEEVAIFYRKVLLDRKDPKQVARRVKAFILQFKSLEYSLDAGKNPYVLPKLLS